MAAFAGHSAIPSSSRIGEVRVSSTACPLDFKGVVALGSQRNAILSSSKPLVWLHTSFLGKPNWKFVAQKSRASIAAFRSGPVDIRNDGQSAVETPKAEEKFQFQAEVNRLMDIIIHSLYSNKEIFLRELISNASDALDKIRFLGASNAVSNVTPDSLKIEVKADEGAQTLTITDSGIGMTRAELIDNLGTIARSGTSKFLDAIGSGKADMNLIGKFGVGFYSAYLVADKVVVRTKNESDKQWLWECQLSGDAPADNFVIREDDGPAMERGTSITLHLKEDAKDFLLEHKLRALIRRYSEFINFPIFLWSSHEEEIPKSPEEIEEEKKMEAEGKEKKGWKIKTETRWEWELVNTNKPVWTRSPRDVTDDEYKLFYRSFFKEYTDPLAWSHFGVEGTVEFKTILYMPEKQSWDQENWMGKSSAIKLYVKRVFIADEFDDLMPRYLSFIRGVVDSEDLPLNVSREILQQSKVLRTMQKRLVGKTLDMISDVANRPDPKPYTAFLSDFGRNLKLGVIEDNDNRKKLLGLLRFYSSKSGEEMTSLESYMNRMKDGQKHIYYIAGESLDAVKDAPFLEKLAKQDIEVLYFTDAIDELMMNHVVDYEGKTFINVSKEDLKLEDDAGDEEKQELEEAEERLKDTIQWIQQKLDNKILKAKVSNRITDSPCVLVTSTFGWTANMERIMKAQAMNDPSRATYMSGQKILEINPKHPLVAELDRRVKMAPEDPETLDFVELLYETALLTSGFSIDNQVAYANRVYRMLELGVANGLGPDVEIIDDEDDLDDDDEEGQVTEAEANPFDELDEEELAEMAKDAKKVPAPGRSAKNVDVDVTAKEIKS